MMWFAARGDGKKSLCCGDVFGIDVKSEKRVIDGSGLGQVKIRL
jgi:hypothetical protein